MRRPDRVACFYGNSMVFLAQLFSPFIILEIAGMKSVKFNVVKNRRVLPPSVERNTDV